MNVRNKILFAGSLTVIGGWTESGINRFCIAINAGNLQVFQTGEIGKG